MPLEQAVGLATDIAILSLLALSAYLVLLVGRISFGQQAYFALGAYASGMASTLAGWALAPSLLLGALALGLGVTGSEVVSYALGIGIVLAAIFAATSRSTPARPGAGSRPDDRQTWGRTPWNSAPLRLCMARTAPVHGAGPTAAAAGAARRAAGGQASESACLSSRGPPLPMFASARSSRSSLSAILRSRTGSYALYTTPIPPCPSASSTTSRSAEPERPPPSSSIASWMDVTPRTREV